MAQLGKQKRKPMSHIYSPKTTGRIFHMFQSQSPNTFNLVSGITWRRVNPWEIIVDPWQPLGPLLKVKF